VCVTGIWWWVDYRMDETTDAESSLHFIINSGIMFTHTATSRGSTPPHPTRFVWRPPSDPWVRSRPPTGRISGTVGAIPQRWLMGVHLFSSFVGRETEFWIQDAVPRVRDAVRRPTRCRERWHVAPSPSPRQRGENLKIGPVEFVLSSGILSPLIRVLRYTGNQP